MKGRHKIWGNEFVLHFDGFNWKNTDKEIICIFFHRQVSETLPYKVNEWKKFTTVNPLMHHASKCPNTL